MTTSICHWVCLILTVAAVMVQSNGDLGGQDDEHRAASSDIMRNLKRVKRPGDNPCDVNTYYCVNENWCKDESVRCNAVKDCKDDSDEKDCDSCWENRYYLCEKDRKCIYRSRLCDNKDHCSDRADERGCAEPSRETICDLAMGAGLCEDPGVPSEYSNYLFHHCNCPLPESHCASYEFPCKDGYCLHKNWVCDNNSDCDDGDDEQNCVEPSVCTLWKMLGYCQRESPYRSFVDRECLGCHGSE